MHNPIEYEAPVEPPKVAAQHTSKGKNRWRQLAILGAALSLDNNEASALVSLFPAIQASLSLSLTNLGLLTAGGRFAGAVMGPLWVWLARRWSRKAVLAICVGAWGGCGIAAGFADGFPTLFVCYAAVAIGAAGAQPIVLSLVSDLFDDATRGRAVGYLFGAVSLTASLVGPLLGQLSGIHDGWRVGFWLVGAMNVLAGLMILFWLEDPGVGATEAGMGRRIGAAASQMSVLSIFRVPTFNLMLLARVLSGPILILTFGVVFLTREYGFPNRLAAISLAPLGIGYFLGTLCGGVLFDRMHKANPNAGRVLFLQMAQLLFAVIAYLATQHVWPSFTIICVFWFFLGLTLGAIPGANRPIVMAVIHPELRGWAFVVMFALVESLVAAVYSTAAGWLSDRFGLKVVFLVALVGLSALNALLMTVLYRTYPRDVARMQKQLDASTC